MKKTPKFFLIDNPPGLCAENIRVLVCIVCGLKSATKVHNSEHFHLSSLLKAVGIKEFNVFKCKKTVFNMFEMYIELLGIFYDNIKLFEDIFKNVLSVFKNSTRNIFNAPVQSLVDLLSLQLTNFSLILRRPDLEKCSTIELIKVCQEELTINEHHFLLEALTEKGSYFQKSNEFKFQPNKSVSSVPNSTITSNNVVQNNASQNKKQATKPTGNKTCFRQLACDLKISSTACTFPKCKFDHIAIPNPVNEAWKKRVKNQVMSATNLSDQKKYADAIDGL